MKIIKKLITFFTFISMLTVMIPAGASSYSDVADNLYYTNAVEALSSYGIISGYNGYFRPDANVSRAEFAKITALISGFEDQVHSNAGNKKFDDVELSHWATGYINTVANNRIIVGYPDGSFQPEKCVTYAEALTVVLRTLGYTTDILGDNWPYAYMIKANSLGFTDGLDLSENDFVSRADLAVIINRALDTDINNSGMKLVTNLEMSVLKDIFIIATAAEDSTLTSDEIRTTAGVYKVANTAFNPEVPAQGDLILNKDGKIVSFSEKEKLTREITTVESVVNNTVYFSDGTNSNSLGISTGTGIYNDGNISTFGAFKMNIKEGAAVSVIFDKFDNVKFLVFGNADFTDAVTVRSDIYTALASVGVTKEMIDRSTVIRDGYAATLDDVEKFDVAYYLADNSTIYLYSDKISGVYNEAYPNKANVTSIDLSGNTFELETQNAVYKLGEKTGSYKIGSRVTALLGKDGKIVDVVDLNSSDQSNYGILLSYDVENSVKALNDGEQERYITVLNGEGNTVKHKTKTNYTEKVGNIGEILFDDSGYASFSSFTSANVITGDVDRINRKIGETWLTSDCVVIERVSDNEKFVSAAVVDFKDIIPNRLTKNNVLHVIKSGDFGDISVLFLQNVTETQYHYGVVTGTIKKEEPYKDGIDIDVVTATYNILVDGKEVSYATYYRSDIRTGTAVALTYNNNVVTSIKKLNSVGTFSNVTAADSGRIKIDDNVYKLHDDVLVVDKSLSGYTTISKYNLKDIIGKTVSLFSSGVSNDDVVVRVITISR